MTCQHCNEPLPRRNSTFCGNVCRREKRLEEIQDRPKQCRHCSESFNRRLKENWDVFTYRKYCSLDCSRAARKTPRDGKKECAGCKENFNQRATEGPAKFNERLFCSNECRKKHEKAKTSKCLQCDGPFRKSRRHKYCSMACYRKAPRSWHSRNVFKEPDFYGEDFE